MSASDVGTSHPISCEHQECGLIQTVKYLSVVIVNINTLGMLALSLTLKLSREKEDRKWFLQLK